MGLYEPIVKKAKLMNMVEKTPISQLQEFCVQEKVAPPNYMPDRDEYDPKKFAYFVQAFGATAKGSGLSKMEAKHVAAASLINLLSQMDRFKNKLSTVKYTPGTPVKEKNAVGDLISFCMQNDFPTPTYKETSSGPPHQPEFTAECKVGGSSCTAKGPTKQKARYFAANAMLIQLTDIEVNNNNDQLVKPLTILDLPTIEEVIAEYRRLRTPHIKRQTSLLRIRPNFFLKLPKSDREIARILLTGKSGMPLTDKEIVNFVCKTLKLTYKIEDIRLQNGNHKIFSLTDVEYDCVVVAIASTLFAKVIEYLKTMLDIEKPSPAMVLQF